MKEPIPIAILSDSPDAASGLGRIARDITGKLYKSKLPVRVSSMGFGGHGSKDLPWTQYNFGPYNQPTDILLTVPSLIDWFENKPGIVLTIFDLHRLEPFRFGELYGPAWNQFLAQQNLQLWGYFPVDGNSPDGALPLQSCEILRAFDRVLAYGPYGQGVLQKCLAKLKPEHPKVKPSDVQWLPHGIDLSIFRDLGRESRSEIKREVKSDIDPSGKREIGVGPNDKLLGIIATNNPRKDWGSSFRVMKNLSERDSSWKFWLHTDQLLKGWNIAELGEQHGLQDQLFITFQLTDEDLAKLYSACDVTLGPGAEGFGFPLVESMACNTPVAHIKIAGGADLLPADCLVDPAAIRTDGPLCLERPVMDVQATADRLEKLASRGRWGRTEVQHYGWSSVWPQWKTWIEEGLDEFKR